MKFCDDLIRLRREKGYSQENLADMLDVSRQAVSKWEAGQAMPDLQKLIALSDIFGVTLDSLVREEEEAVRKTAAVQDNRADLSACSGECPAQRWYRGYEYKSKSRLFGIPLVHIHFARNRVVTAKGIVAIGNIAVGVVSLGGVSVGALSIGAVSVGLLALGAAAVGGVALGGLSVGLLSLGGLAIGKTALGGLAIGKIAVGGAAVGSSLAAGDAAFSSGVEVGRSVSEGARAALRVTSEVTSEQIRAFLAEQAPWLWKPLADSISHMF